MNLAELIESRAKELGISLREMARRADAQGTPISAATLSAYRTGKRTAFPAEETREALARALDVSVERVKAAAANTAAPEATEDPDPETAANAEAWLRLTEGRTEEERRHLLAVVAATIRAIDSTRSQ